MALFLVESPFQLLCALEAEDHFKFSESYFLIRLSGEKRNDEQLLRLSNEFLKEKNYKILFIRSKKKSLKDYARFFLYKGFFFVRLLRAEKIFVGNIESRFLNYLIKGISKNKIILLDDGAKTLIIHTKYADNKCYNLFTIYDLMPYKNQKIYKNQFLRLKRNFSNYEVETEVLFLGTKLTELGFVTHQQYISYLKKIVDYFDTKKIIYIPHRGEDINKLKTLQTEIPQLSITKLNFPVELYGLNFFKKPSIVASFYSTALLTIKYIYNCDIVSFKYDYGDSKNKDDIDQVYNFYEKHINVVALE